MEKAQENEENQLSAAENYSDYANSFSLTSFALCSTSTPHLNGKIYTQGSFGGINASRLPKQTDM